MAKARALDRRRKSIQSTRKITHTMELISTATYRKAMDRAVSATAYTNRLTAMVGQLARAGLEVQHPLLQKHENTENVVILTLTSNRGMCGGFNGAVLRLAAARYKELTQAGLNITVDCSGKRGVSGFKFRQIPVAESFLKFEDKPAYIEVEKIADKYLDLYQAGKLDRLDVVYTKLVTVSKQTAVVETLLPLTELASGETETSTAHDYEFLPSAKSILEEVVPASFKMKLFKCFLDSAVSEQIARMVAMKSATENADQMVKTLSQAYNRARQGQITGELTELIGGVEALK